jgi:Type IV secretory system Conjugative DNA transfer
LESAEELSERIGDTTIRVVTPTGSTDHGRSTSGDKPGQSHSSSTSSGINTSQESRKLLMKDEILRLHDVALIFHNHLPVIAARTIKHFRDPAFTKGRMGRQPGLGIGAKVMTAAALVASLMLLILAVWLPLPRFQGAPPRIVVPIGGQHQNVGPLPSSGSGVSTKATFTPAGAAGGQVFGTSNHTKGASDGR